MPDLLEPAHPGGGDREIAAAPAGGGRRGGAAARPAGPALLEFVRVSKWYGPVIGLNEVTLRLEPGITGLVGPNGAGKSTLMKLATGQLRPSLGHVLLRGKPAWAAGAKWHLGYCPDADNFFEEMSGRRFVFTMAKLFGFARGKAKQRTEQVLEQVGMADRADRKLRGYSKGMRQRIKLAQSLVHDPELLILDEPLNGVDPVGRTELNKLFVALADAGKSLLISSHQLEELEKLTDRIAIIARGMLVAHGTVSEIRELMNDQPLAVRIDSDRPRQMASALLRLPDVLGVELTGDAAVIARARNPRRFFPDLGHLVLDEGFDVQHLETLDNSAQAILDYLVRDGR
jgi:ABC-2 type transport system ATP-binding protein